MPPGNKKRVSEERKNKILIADDHNIVVEGIMRAIENQPGFEIVGSASDGLKALKLVKTLNPDIVILDISMPKLDGISAAYEIKGMKKNINIIVFTMHSDREYALSLFRAGVSGYILKDESISDLILALKTVAGGGTYYSRKIDRTLHEHMEELELGDKKRAKELQNGVALLSVREKEVFPLLADGMTVREVSERLGISPKTVETHKYNIMEKLNVKTIAGLTKIAMKKNLIKL
jgi:RNA polymerase sigma factor (sigma-70 family)